MANRGQSRPDLGSEPTPAPAATGSEFEDFVHFAGHNVSPPVASTDEQAKAALRHIKWCQEHPEAHEQQFRKMMNANS